MPNLGATGLTPATTTVAIPAGYRNGSGVVAAVTAAIDANIADANIIVGKTILGIAGTAVDGALMVGSASGSGTSAGGAVVVTGLTFQPDYVELNWNSGTYLYIFSPTKSTTRAYAVGSTMYVDCTVNSSGFSFPSMTNGLIYAWKAKG